MRVQYGLQWGVNVYASSACYTHFGNKKVRPISLGNAPPQTICHWCPEKVHGGKKSKGWVTHPHGRSSLQLRLTDVLKTSQMIIDNMSRAPSLLSCGAKLFFRHAGELHPFPWPCLVLARGPRSKAALRQQCSSVVVG